MRRILVIFVFLASIPAVVMAWPQPGDTAPSLTLPDTAGVSHVVPADYAHHVLHLVFWEST